MPVFGESDRELPAAVRNDALTSGHVACKRHYCLAPSEVVTAAGDDYTSPAGSDDVAIVRPYGCVVAVVRPIVEDAAIGRPIFEVAAIGRPIAEIAAIVRPMSLASTSCGELVAPGS